MEDATIDVELTAIKAITEALIPLDKDARQRVLNYVIAHLGLLVPPPIFVGSGGASNQVGGATKLVDIRSFKEEKNPTIDVEMATVVAYYLKYVAPEDERKDEIGADDIEKYFIQADYPLPSEIKFTLPNAKKAGYLESASRGKYKMNSVGHNLVAHNMPRTSNASVSKAKKRSPKKPVKRNSKIS